MFWSKLCKSSWNCAWNLAFPVFISPIVWNMCENLHYESVYFKELHNQQEYYWPTIYRTGAAVVSTITSYILSRFFSYFVKDIITHNKCYLIKCNKQQEKYCVSRENIVHRILNIWINNLNFYYFLQFTVGKPELITTWSFSKQRSHEFFL